MSFDVEAKKFYADGKGKETAGKLDDWVEVGVFARGASGFDATGHMAANGYGTHSPGGYSLTAVLVAEGLFSFGLTYLTQWIGQHALFDLRARIVRHIENQRLAFLQ